MAHNDGSSDEAERERAYRRWEDKYIQELSQDPELHRQMDEDNRRIALGLEPEGRLVTYEELKRLAGDTQVGL